MIHSALQQWISSPGTNIGSKEDVPSISIMNQLQTPHSAKLNYNLPTISFFTSWFLAKKKEKGKNCQKKERKICFGCCRKCTIFQFIFDLNPRPAFAPLSNWDESSWSCHINLIEKSPICFGSDFSTKISKFCSYLSINVFISFTFFFLSKT